MARGGVPTPTQVRSRMAKKEVRATRLHIMETRTVHVTTVVSSESGYVHSFIY